ncbi:MAG TPA: hypothetical protein VFH73_25145 [Polyangia bacterium]|jgi:hypothetical protein|nr:hypothetical protein [Polyangia bacterium]
MRPQDIERMGDPDLRVGGLSLWIHGRAYEDSTDYWDGNWLRVTALCRYPGAWTSTEGTILHLREVTNLLAGCEKVFETLAGNAALDCLEPNLKVEINSTGSGHLAVRISITPDQLTQSHSYTDELDQTYLPAVISGCRSILAKYPIRGTDPAVGGV